MSVHVPFYLYKLDKNSVNTQKQQFKNDIFCLHLCVYFLIGKMFPEIFTSYSICIKALFSVDLSLFKQSIQILGPYH